jgi:hypothetical protein
MFRGVAECVGGSRGPDTPAKTRATRVNRANPMSLLGGEGEEGTTAVVPSRPPPICGHISRDNTLSKVLVFTV